MQKLMLLLILMLVSTGCYNTKDKIGTKLYVENEVEEIDIKNLVEDEKKDVREKKITDEIKKIKYIENVTVVITGEFAVIGMELNKEITDGDVMNLKNQIKKLTKDTDKEVKYVSITTTPTLVKKINDLVEDRSEKKDIELSEELEETIVELTPKL